MHHATSVPGTPPSGQWLASSPSIVFMGVAGCGKSTLAAAVARALALPLVEGDDFHSESSRAKMRQGIALDDRDRDAWLELLRAQLRDAPKGIALTCSALKHSYRERLRASRAGLLFVFLDITVATARARVAARNAHFFSASLVESQFTTLESPAGEPGVLVLDATDDLEALTAHVVSWVGRAHARSPAAALD